MLIIVIFGILFFQMVICRSSLSHLKKTQMVSENHYSTFVDEFAVKTDTESSLNKKEEETFVQNLPYNYIEDNVALPSGYNKTCAKFPNLLDIKFTSDFWQSQKTKKGTLQLFSADVDHRNVSDGKKAVRIIGMYDQFSSKETVYCQYWYEENSQPVFVQSEKLIWIWFKGWGGNFRDWYHPYIITCLLPEDVMIPVSVSVVENPCDSPTNNLKLSYKQAEEEDRKNFVVCVKGLNFPYDDKSVRLIEWIELLFILGADKINFYKFHVHPKVEKVLNYYANLRKVEISPISLIVGASNSPYLQSRYLKNKILKRRLQEVIPYNDCLYKHLQEYKFVVLLDIDEVVVPQNGTWLTLLQSVEEDKRSSYVARNVYFFDNYQHNHTWFEGIPTFFNMLQHVYRAKDYTGLGHYVKGFHDTRYVSALHNHFPISCLGNCKHSDIDVQYGHLQHYRGDCVKDVKECDVMQNNLVMDNRVWNYKDDLISNTLHTLTDLDMIV